MKFSDLLKESIHIKTTKRHPDGIDYLFSDGAFIKADYDKNILKAFTKQGKEIDISLLDNYKQLIRQT